MSKNQKSRKSKLKNKEGNDLTLASLLRDIRTDISQMETHSVDGTLVLVPKADVLEIVQDWLEYVLNPDE